MLRNGSKKSEVFCQKDDVSLIDKGQCPDAPILLVGTKIDLRDNPKEVTALKSAKGRDPITKDQGNQLAEGIGAHKYVE